MALGDDPSTVPTLMLESLEGGEGSCLWKLLPRTISPGMNDEERSLGSTEKDLSPPFSLPDACRSSLLKTRWRQPDSKTGAQLKVPAAAGQMVLEYLGPVILRPQSSPTTATVTAIFMGLRTWELRAMLGGRTWGS